ncbi:CcdC protein domain-containing protein [Streptomyces sp. RPT161]|uniref:CcdC protein domain-containing protein n=1 Tax=Streptomyces sp. RPT161 TaxID=3015993 RepID=UPI0022B86FF9|nr:CcdC protein domain-containing protein [Streptomyces sp. RPT161]
MSGLTDVAVIIAVVVLVLARQLRPQKVADSARWWILPVVLVVLSVRNGGVVDNRHVALSVGLLAAEIVVGLGMGAVWAYTTRLWREADGSVWARGAKATTAAWTGGVLLRIGLAAVGAVLGVHQGSGATMLALAATLLVRTGLVMWRARELEPAYRVTAAAP